MDYYNQITPQYLDALKKAYGYYRLKIELLSENETVVGEIVKNISIDAAGQINVNYQQLTRRSCSLSLINIDNQYAPNQNSWFWYKRKFKVWIGLKWKDDCWWFSNGVFITNSAQGDGHLINIEATDKGGLLDGTFKYNLLDGKIIIEKGSKIAQLIRETLLLNDGHSLIDPTIPLIDREFEDIVIEQEIILSENTYIGELFSELGENYGADVFYDTNGRLNFTKLCDGDRVDGYRYLGSQYDFTDEETIYLNSTINYDYNSTNAITVYTNISAKTDEGKSVTNQRYTAYNRNPKSPLNIDSIGIRRMESIEIPYINGLTEDKMKDRCKQYADYNLIKHSLQQLSMDFTSVIIPHLDVNKIITITDKVKQANQETYVVQSITFPLSANEMNISATNIEVLPNDIDIERSGYN